MPPKPTPWALPALCAAATAAALLRPGDAPWIYDEPRLIEYALQNLRAGTVPWHGILGSHGVLYGPAAIWFYEALLSVTRDLYWMVRIHALVILGGCAASVFWLSRLEPELEGPWGGVVLLSPYFWIYGRMLWDNTLLLPLSGLALCLYLSFCRAPRRRKAAALAALLSLCALTHLMSLVFIAPILLHAFLFRRRWLADNARFCAGLALAAAALCAPYAKAALGEFAGAASPMPSIWLGWVFPLLGGRYFSGLGFGYFLGDGWPAEPWAKLACWASAAALPLVWYGVVLAARRARASKGEGFDALALGVLGLQCLVYGVARVYGHPHYLGPGWLVSLYFLWTGLSAMPRRDIAGWIYGGAVTLSLIAAASSVARTGGTRGLHYGPTLENQLGVARALNTRRPGPLSMEVQHYRLFPQALSTLVDLYDLKGDKNAPPVKLAIVYREPEGPDARIALSVAN